MQGFTTEKFGTNYDFGTGEETRSLFGNVYGYDGRTSVQKYCLLIIVFEFMRARLREGEIERAGERKKELKKPYSFLRLLG